MIRNDLKELLPENWRSIFSHRFCDPENYEVGVFTIEEKEKILVLNPDTLDIMEYFFDDKPDDYWIDLTPILERLFPNFIFLNHVYHINKKYEIILNGEFNKITFLKSIKYNETGGTGLYPRKSFYSDEKRIHIKSIHIIIGHVFVPNSSPENNNIINHKNSSKGDFLKENLEWCDY